MVFYFSGTGNSKWVAEKISEIIGDKSYDISKLNEIPGIENENQVGFVFPIYAWGIPEPMEVFAKKLKATSVFTFGICTCGEDAGIALKKFSKIYRLDSCYSISMPSNYIIGADVEEEESIWRKIESAKKEIKRIGREIIQKKKVYHVQEGSFPRLKSIFVNKGFNKFARTTKPFYVTEQCNGCGQCERECPSASITLVNGRPTWKNSCFQCLRCINRCPKSAIQYGKTTEKRGRYTIEKYI